MQVCVCLLPRVTVSFYQWKTDSGCCSELNVQIGGVVVRSVCYRIQLVLIFQYSANHAKFLHVIPK